MKQFRFLFLLFAFCFPISTLAADRITALVTITNAPTTNHFTFVVNADTRLWTNAVDSTATQILTNDSINGIATNLFNHLVATPPANVSVSMTETNILRLAGRTGSPLDVSGDYTYFSVVYSTQTVASAYDVIVPYTSFPSSLRQSMTEGLVDWLNLASGKALFENSASVSNLLGNTNSQYVAGIKQFTNVAGIWKGYVSNAPSISGNVYMLTNGTYWDGTFVDPTVTNGTFHGAAVYHGAVDFNEPITFNGLASSIDAEADYFALIPETGARVYLGTYGLANGISALSAHFTNQVYAGTVYATNTIAQGPSQFANTNQFIANADIAFTRYALTTLANGNNAAVPVGTNVFVQVSGPSGAFSVNGIDGQPNRDGKMLILLNYTTQNMTIVHDSGVDPVAANRIYTLTGSDVATTGNGAAILIYSASASRWILIASEL